MKLVNVKIIKSLQYNDGSLLSIRGEDGHALTLKEALPKAGFHEGEDAVILNKEQFDKLKKERDEYKPFYDAYYK